MAGTLSELLAGMHDERRASVPKPLAEAIVMELRETFARYGACPYKPGDLVTPASNASLRGAGEPHIVLEVAPDARPDFERGTPSTTVFGCRHQMRVLSRAGDGALVAHWVEAFEFVPWTGERA